ALNKIAGSSVLDKFNLRRPAEKAIYHGARSSFQAIGQAQRTFAKKKGSGQAERPADWTPSGVYDLNPTEDQQMMVDVISEFATEVLRPATEAAEAANDTSKEVLSQTTDFGLSLINIPESLGGLSAERSAVTGVLVAE